MIQLGFQHTSNVIQTAGINYMDCLPREVLSQILGELDILTLGKAARVCHRWYGIISENNGLWKKLFDQHYPADNRVKYDRYQLGLSWKECFMRKFKSTRMKRRWLDGEFSHVTSFTELPAKSMCVLNTEAWGEILQMELNR